MASTFPVQMTAQISDALRYRGRAYRLSEYAGEGLFIPEVHGIQQEIISTACWRGHYCDYEVVDDRLYLTRLSVFTRKGVEKLELAGVSPKPITAGFGHVEGEDLVTEEVPTGEWVFEGLRVPVKFTGWLRLGGRKGYYGQCPPGRYWMGRSLFFENGVLKLDRSGRKSVLRQIKTTEHPAEVELC